METKIDIDNWSRKQHFLFFSQFEEPFYGLTISVDCTVAYRRAKEQDISFYLYYLYRALKAANETEAFRYRIVNDDVYLFDQVHATPTVDRPDGSFGFAYLNYDPKEKIFNQHAKSEIQKVRASHDLLPAASGENFIQFSAIPWLNFSSLSHARRFKAADSCPKISFGKLDKESPVKKMPVSIHVHHGLVDARQVAEFVDRFQELMNQ